MHSDANVVMDFFTLCKTLVATNGLTVAITLHPGALPADVALRVRSICDCYFMLKSASVAGRSVKVAEIVKLIGSRAQSSTQFSFDVDQTFGIKIVPISMANA
jgi:flagellar protein FlaH